MAAAAKTRMPAAAKTRMPAATRTGMPAATEIHVLEPTERIRRARRQSKRKPERCKHA
jgi:hypothetical protein